MKAEILTGLQLKAKGTHPCDLRVTEEQKEILTTAATRAGLGVSSWLLMLGLRAARSDDE